MKKSCFYVSILGVLLLVLLIAGCGGEKQNPQGQSLELNISAAVSLKDVLNEIQQNYQAQAPNVKLVFNYGASGSLQQQIEQGAPADIFISAAPDQMNALEAKNLIDKATRKNLVENELVLIVPGDSALRIHTFEDLAQPGIQKIAVGEPKAVPAGQYAQQVLQKLGLWDPIKEKSIQAKDVRSVLAYVETGNVEAGIVYQTDAASSAKVKIAAVAPAGLHQPIVYPIAILAGTKQHQAAQAFLTYLFTPESKAVFQKYGFKTATDQ